MHALVAKVIVGVLASLALLGGGTALAVNLLPADRSTRLDTVTPILVEQATPTPGATPTPTPSTPPATSPAPVAPQPPVDLRDDDGPDDEDEGEPDEPDEPDQPDGDG